MSNQGDTLFVRLQQLDESAPREFALTYGPRLYRLFLHRGFSQADAESFAATAVSQAVLNIDRFEPSGPTSFDRWVYSVARRVQINDWRQRRRNEPLVEEPAWPEAPDWEPGPAAVSEALETALAELSEEARAVVFFRAVEGLSFQEISQRLNLNEGTARVKYHRALEQLQARLEDHPAVRTWRGLSSEPSGGQQEIES
jgi:RNA polymerase sigma-70 factor (ECF subfamily)